VLGRLKVGERVRIIGTNLPEGVRFDAATRSLIVPAKGFPRGWPGPRIEIELPQSMVPNNTRGASCI
jgi:hypothetical protein